MLVVKFVSWEYNKGVLLKDHFCYIILYKTVILTLSILCSTSVAELAIRLAGAGGSSGLMERAANTLLTPWSAPSPHAASPDPVEPSADSRAVLAARSNTSAAAPRLASDNWNIQYTILNIVLSLAKMCAGKKYVYLLRIYSDMNIVSSPEETTMLGNYALL